MKKQFYGRERKATILDYDYMQALSDDECCYSLSERETQLLLAIIDPIGWATRYEQEREDIDQSTIEKWRDNLARKLMEGCCPDEVMTRFTAEGVFQTSSDGGVTWVDNPDDDPRNDYVSAPPLGGEGDSTKCAAADNARDQFKAMRDQIISLLEAASAVLVIIAALIGALGFIAGISVAGIGISVLLFGISAGLLSATPESVATDLSDEIMDQFRCILFCHVENNGEFTYDEWLAVIADIDSTFSGFAQTFFHGIVAAMGFIGLSNAGTIGAATADDCGDCPDCETTCSDKLIPYIGTHIGTFAGYERYEAAINPGNGLWTIAMKADDIDDCCQILDVQNVVAGASRLLRIACGVPDAPENFINNWNLESCNHHYAADQNGGSNVTFTLDILFADC